MFRYLIIIVVKLYTVRCQIAEIASLVSGLLSPALLNSAANVAPLAGIAGSAGASGASAATSLLSNIPALYKLAEGALQLTGTGVNILNQASEGRWFSTMLEGAMNTQRELQDRYIAAGRDYSQLGTNFPAPSPGDYDHEDIDSVPYPNSLSSSSTELTTTEIPITLFPEEKNVGSKKEIEKILEKNIITESNEDGESERRPSLRGTQTLTGKDYEERVEKEDNEKTSLLNKIKELLKKNELNETQLRELITDFEKSTTLSTTRTSSPSAEHRYIPIGTLTDTDEDSDLLQRKITVTRANHQLLANGFTLKPIIIRKLSTAASSKVTVPPRRKFRTRTAYRATLVTVPHLPTTTIPSNRLQSTSLQPVQNFSSNIQRISQVTAKRLHDNSVLRRQSFASPNVGKTGISRTHLTRFPRTMELSRVQTSNVPPSQPYRSFMVPIRGQLQVRPQPFPQSIAVPINYNNQLYNTRSKFYDSSLYYPYNIPNYSTQ